MFETPRFKRTLSGNRFPFWKQVKTIYADRDKSPWGRSQIARVDSSGSARKRESLLILSLGLRIPPVSVNGGNKPQK